MNENEINAAIAKEFGIEVLEGQRMGRKKGWGDGDWKMLPDFYGSLDCCAMFEATLGDLKNKYAYELQKLTGSLEWSQIHATAPQRSEAFLRTKGLWK